MLGRNDLKTSEAFCYKCRHKKTCIEICPDLEVYLRELEQGNRGETTKNPDDIDNFCGVSDDHFPDEAQQDSWERRCLVAQEAREYFKSFGKQSSDYLLVWGYIVGEELSQTKISELMGISQQHVSKIITKIKERKERYQ